jgi:DNA-binding NarL/FixJ family response regulator
LAKALPDQGAGPLLVRDDEFVHQLTEAGASGYLVKHTAASDLIKAVREIAKGNAYFSPSILKRLLELYRESNVQGRPSDRETST